MAKTQTSSTTGGGGARPGSAHHEPLAAVTSLLAAGKTDEALHAVNRLGLRDGATQNARAVCLMRLGKADEAVRVLRAVVLKGGLLLRDDVPEAYKVNMAVALAMSGNAAGAVAILSEIDAEQHPQVQKLRAAIHDWKRTLSLGERLKWMMGANIERPVPFDGAPGEIA